MSASGRTFIKQAEDVSTHILNGINFVEKYASFLNDRAQIENEYASKLQGLSKKYDMDAKNKPVASFTYVDVHSAALKQLKVIATQHGSFATRLNKAVSETGEGISDTVRSLLARHQNCVKQLNDLKSGLDRSVGDLKTAMKAFVSEWNNSVLAEQKYQKADANQKLPRKVINEAKALSAEQARKALDAEKIYKRTLGDTNQHRRTLYDRKLPDLLQQLKSLDIDRINVLGTAIDRGATLEQAIWPEVQVTFKEISQLNGTLNAESDANQVLALFEADVSAPRDIELVEPQEREILHEDTLLNALSGELDDTNDLTRWVASITPTAADVSNMLKGVFRFPKLGGRKSDGGRSPGSGSNISSVSVAGTSTSQSQRDDDGAFSVAPSTPSAHTFQSTSTRTSPFEHPPGSSSVRKPSLTPPSTPILEPEPGTRLAATVDGTAVSDTSGIGGLTRSPPDPAATDSPPPPSSPVQISTTQQYTSLSSTAPAEHPATVEQAATGNTDLVESPAPALTAPTKSSQDHVGSPAETSQRPEVEPIAESADISDSGASHVSSQAATTTVSQGPTPNQSDQSVAPQLPVGSAGQTNPPDEVESTDVPYSGSPPTGQATSNQEGSARSKDQADNTPRPVVAIGRVLDDFDEFDDRFDQKTMLTMQEGEKFHVLEVDNGDGWSLVRYPDRRLGTEITEGVVPRDLLEILPMTTPQKGTSGARPADIPHSPAKQNSMELSALSDSANTSQDRSQSFKAPGNSPSPTSAKPGSSPKPSRGPGPPPAPKPKRMGKEPAKPGAPGVRYIYQSR